MAKKVKGEKVIDGKAYYFLENGLQARDSLVKGSDGLALITTIKTV